MTSQLETAHILKNNANYIEDMKNLIIENVSSLETKFEDYWTKEKIKEYMK